MSTTKHIYSLLAGLLLCLTSYSQIHCGLVELDQSTSSNSIMTFDTFSKYAGGITYNGVTKVRVTVEDKAIVDPLCSWNLSMIVNNNPGSGTPVSEWEELIQYGNGLSDNPSIDLLEIRVRNNCATSPINGTWQTFTNDMDIIDIISPLLLITPAGSCAAEVNGPGSYLTNYDEFNFSIDIRVRPDFSLNPGIFELNVRFHLEENP